MGILLSVPKYLVFHFPNVRQTSERSLLTLSESISKDKVRESIWLLYFNQVLYEKGVITEKERNKMSSLINRRTSAQQKL